MKRKLLLPVMLCLMVNVLHAQSIHGGIKGGMNLSLNSGEGMSESLQAGYDIGGYMTIGFGSKWAIQPELFYSQRNPKAGGDFLKYYNVDGNSLYSPTSRLSYISLPVLAKYNVAKWLAISAGPQFNYIAFDDDNFRRDYADAYKKTDAGIAGQVELALDRVMFYLRYYHGFSNINNMDNRYTWKSRQVGVGIAYRIW